MGCSQKKVVPKNQKKNIEIFDPERNDTIFLGDINGDFILDSAFVYTPPTLSTLDSNGNVAYTLGCVNDSCYNKVKFSCHLPDILIENSVWGRIESIEDINNDGYKEMLFSTNWFTTTKSTLFLYSFSGYKWIIIEKVSIRSSDEDISLKYYFIKSKKGCFLKGITQKDGDEIEILKRVKCL